MIWKAPLEHDTKLIASSSVMKRYADRAHYSQVTQNFYLFQD